MPASEQPQLKCGNLHLCSFILRIYSLQNLIFYRNALFDMSLFICIHHVHLCTTKYTCSSIIQWSIHSILVQINTNDLFRCIIDLIYLLKCDTIFSIIIYVILPRKQLVFENQLNSMYNRRSNRKKFFQSLSLSSPE